MRYVVNLDPDAKAELSRLSPDPKSEVNKVLKRLVRGPDLGRGDLQLQGEDNQLQDEDDLWRALAGRRWRVVFAVLPGRRIEVRRIRRRPLAYKGIEHPGRQELQEDAAPYPGEAAPITLAAHTGSPMPRLAATRRDSVTEVTEVAEG